MLPRVAVTLGDVAGIGPEVTARACVDERVLAACRPVVVGDPTVLRRATELVGSPRVVRALSALDWSNVDGAIGCWNPSGEDVASVRPGANDARAGEAAYQWLVAATRAALAGTCDAVVTAPLSKAALHLAGRNYPGHTEILAELCGVRDYAMMLYLPPGGRVAHGLAVAHATLHTSVRSVPDLLSAGRVAATVGLVSRFLGSLGRRKRVGVCALNPHAGEEGLFGDEESRIIAPGVEQARGAGLDVAGPFPADTLIKRAVDGEFDGVVAMYHDQGHIALKLIGFGRAVNVTLGLPIVRTSPSHGTAFDIAWTGRADPEGMVGAILVAAELVARRRADGGR